MTQQRFNALSILCTHKHLTDTIDLVSVGNEFIALNDQREQTFGQFVLSDFEK